MEQEHKEKALTMQELIALINNAKGEFVLVIEGAEKPKKSEFTLEDAVLMAKDHIKSGMSASEAAKKAAAETGLKKGNIYKAIL